MSKEKHFPSLFAEAFSNHGDLNECLEVWADAMTSYSEITAADVRLLERCKALLVQSIEEVNRNLSRANREERDGDDT